MQVMHPKQGNTSLASGQPQLIILRGTFCSASSHLDDRVPGGPFLTSDPSGGIKEGMILESIIKQVTLQVPCLWQRQRKTALISCLAGNDF